MTTETPSDGLEQGFPTVQGIRALAELCRRAGVNELEAGDGTIALRLRIDLQNMPSPSTPEAIAATIADDVPGPHVLRSPWVGILHRSAEGALEPYAQPEDTVEEGDVVAVIVAMQLQHELRADRTGTLVRFLVADEEPVEYGQPLLELS